MDPQHRILLQLAWHALEDANINPQNYSEEIGVFAGCGQNDYLAKHVLPHLSSLSLSEQYQLMLSHQINFLVSKVSYKLNLKGPAVSVQTACSTSLVAVHQAVNALKVQDCGVAIAGGVSIGKLERAGYLHEEGLVFSKDGYCRAFDEKASGTFEGQGGGLVVLTPLKEALAKKLRIYAVIKGCAINNDGNDKIGYTAPSVTRQADVVNKALGRAKLKAKDIDLIETHGTGTSLGDPIEIAALSKVFSGQTTTPITLSALKSHIGHLDVAAGVSGLMISALSLYHRKQLPIKNFKTINPKINFANSPFTINKELRTLSQKRLVAGISSFGIGGTNAHVVLTNFTREINNTNDATNSKVLISLSAHSKEALQRLKLSYLELITKWQQEGHSLRKVAYSLHLGRAVLKEQWHVSVASFDELSHALQESVPFPVDKPFRELVNKLKNRESIDWRKYYQNEEMRVELPLYPFEKSVYWYEKKNTEHSEKSFSELMSELKAERPLQGSTMVNIKEKVSGFFAELLGEEIDEEDEDFFELGGDSLLAVTLTSKLKTLFGVKIDLMSLSPLSVNKLSDFIHSEKQDTLDEEPLVVLRKPEHATSKLLLIHPIGGDIYFYRDLISGLNNSYEIYAMRSPMLSCDCDYHSISEMAADYLELACDLFNDGSLVLLGSSFGGLVAFEMAKSYQKTSGKSLPVVMVDTPCYGNLPPLMSSEEVLDYLVEHGLGALKKLKEPMEACKSLQEKISLLANASRGGPLEDMLSEAFLPQFLKTWRKHGELMHAYRPEVYTGDVLFFDHSEEITEFPSGQSGFWRDYVSGSFTQQTLNGTHITMNESPNIFPVSDALNIHLSAQEVEVLP